jgi:hypothetical protein
VEEIYYHMLSLKYYFDRQRGGERERKRKREYKAYINIQTTLFPSVIGSP